MANDAEDVENRRERAFEARRVPVYHQDDEDGPGTAGLWILMPTTDVVARCGRLTRLAEGGLGANDPRTRISVALISPPLC
ncbi:hypothetical protein SAMN05443637_107226 [Pseudonocardia thermophila]|jgi:hypothetical protein|uniref:Uncharacterized protein n=1 Tax=Pseudonocardia thermophila TaxID=1848 RepID=A0A1M6T8M9_PSETH|nr:hypothetical protein [Pseudonocardia thermophila]SHK53347.1 hypothetical protein SAMN05443637_107226 [Pseudonocardia thermophila]